MRKPLILKQNKTKEHEEIDYFKLASFYSNSVITDITIISLSEKTKIHPKFLENMLSDIKIIKFTFFFFFFQILPKYINLVPVGLMCSTTHSSAKTIRILMR